jgi:hypothetical protein
MKPPQGIIEIDGKRYEWRYNDCICGLYEVEEKEGAGRNLTCSPVSSLGSTGATLSVAPARIIA